METGRGAVAGGSPWRIAARRWGRRRHHGWAAMAVVWEYRAVSVQRGIRMLRAKALAGHVLVDMTATP